MTIATRFQGLASRLVDKFASTATLQRTTEGAYDPVEGDVTTDTQTFNFKITPPKAYTEALIDGTLIQQNDFQVFIASDAGVEPIIGDRLIYNEVTYSVIRVVEASTPDNDVAGYRMQCRG